MKDDFYKWHEVKSALNDKSGRVLFHEGEVWWCSIGMNVGKEIFGKGDKFTRPVLIFKKFTRNSFMGLLLTSKNKNGSWYVGVKFHDRIQTVILNQARTMDSKRLQKRIGTLDDLDLLVVQKRFIEFYAP